MPKDAVINQQLKNAQRDNILAAARKVFAHKGIAATIDDIAVEAKVSHGLAYRYFPSKDAILQVLIEQVLEQSSRLDHLQQIPGTPGERLERFVSAMIELRREPELFQILSQLLNADATPNHLRLQMAERLKKLSDQLRSLLTAAQASGEAVDGDPEQLVRAIFAALNGLDRWATYDPDHYLDHFPDARIFLRMLKP